MTEPINNVELNEQVLKCHKKMLKYKPARLKIDIDTDHSTLVREFFKHDCIHLIP